MKLLLLFLISAPIVSLASLPYEGANECKSNIKRPESPYFKNLDAGVEVDKDCKTVFVLPPKRGKAIMSSFSLTGGAELCHLYEYAITAESVLPKIMELRDRLINSENLTAEEIENLKMRIKYGEDMENSIRTQLERSKNTIGLVAKMYFETDWDKLVSAYQKANENNTQKFFFKKVPVSASILSFQTTKAKGGLTDLSDVIGENRASSDGVYDFVVPGIRVNNSVNLREMLGLEDLAENNVVFGNSLSGQLQLNHFGMCSMKSFFESLTHGEMTLAELNNKAIVENIDAQVVSNLTVYYPVYLKRRYEISIDSSQVATVIDNFVKTKNTFSTKEVVDLFSNTEHRQDIKITFENENPNDNQDGQIEDLKTQILDDVILRIINQVADKVPNSYEVIDLDPPADPHIFVTNTRRLCRSKSSFFGLSRSKKCWTESYQVKTTVEGRADARIQKIIKLTAKYNQNATYFNTILRTTTLAFTKDN